MKIIRNDLKNDLNIRTEKDFPVKGVEFIDITPLFLQKDTLNEMCNKFVKEIKPLNVDYIVGPEARGFLLASMIAIKVKAGVITARKKGKIPPVALASRVEYEKEYGMDILELPKLVNDTYKGKKFYIVDDIYATGSTMKAISGEIKKLGGIVLGEGVIINIKELNDAKNVFSLIDINED